MRNEPVLTSSGVVALILAVCALFGVVLSDVQINALAQIAAVVVPLIVPIVGGYIARKKVSPVSERPLPPE